MPPDDQSFGPDAEPDETRYYKSLYLKDPVVYVQADGLWRSYAPGGNTAQTAGSIPEAILAQVIEISPAEGDPLVRERLEEEMSRATQSIGGPVGLGGWLILPILGLLTTLFESVWALTHRSAEALDAGTGGALLIGYDLLMTLLSVALLLLVFMKNRLVRRLMMGYYGLCLLITVALWTLWFASSGNEAGEAIARIIPDLLIPVLLDIVWIMYFLRSERVKNTFVKPRRRETHPV